MYLEFNASPLQDILKDATRSLYNNIIIILYIIVRVCAQEM